MAAPPPLRTTLLPGSRALLAFHARELPQRDDLCGAFCGALALRAAGIERFAGAPLDRADQWRGDAGEPIDQDAVALAAGSVVSAVRDTGNLPHGEAGRRDYRLALPCVDDAAVSGTTAAGVVGAIERLGAGSLAAIPYSGPWTATVLDGLFELVAGLERPVALIANLATRHLWGGHARLDQLLDHLYDGTSSGPPPDWDVGHFVCVFGRVRGPRGTLYGVADTYPSLGDRRRAHAAGRAPHRGDRAARQTGRWRGGRARHRRRRARAHVRTGAGVARGRLGQRERDGGDTDVSSTELVALVCCDLGGIVRGRSLPAAELEETLRAGVGWVPANHSLTPHGPLAARTPFDSTGDLRLLPDPGTHVRVEAEPVGGGLPDTGALELVLCDIVETDGTPWECCPRRFLRDALAELERELGARVLASFEHEFQLMSAERAPAVFSPGAPTAASSLGPPAAPFSLEALRRAEPFAAEAVGALIEAGARPERIFAEFAPHQFEIPVEAAEGVAAADRAVVLREVVREVARRRGLRATFTPLLHPDQPGNGVHIHLNLLDAEGAPLLHDAARPGCLSELGGRFAAGILRHAGALCALCAPSPVSAARLHPHRWSAGAVCVGERNREVLLRIPPLVALAAAGAGGHSDPSRASASSPDLAPQLRLEYRGADAAANPHLALGAILRAGLDGVRAGLAPPPILDRDPAHLDAAEAERFGVGALPASLEDALRALAEDDTARAWLGGTLYEAYVGVKRAELDAVAELDLGEVCRRYAAIY